jgi:SAM-dependent methyltransferase
MKTFTSLANPEYESTPFVNFGRVSSRTKLETLNLNWRERDLPERERTKHVHRLHPYLGKYIPQIVEIFLRKFKPSRVFDPFCGSGTTLVEANVLGIKSIGCDISAFNVLVARAKVAQYEVEKMEQEVRGALQELHARFEPGLFGEPENVENQNEYLRDWFHPDALRALLLYRSLIPNYHYQDLLKVILSRSARSSRLTAHHNLDFPRKPQCEPYDCRKHDRICSPTTDAFQFLWRYSLDTIERAKEFAKIRTNAKSEVVWGDAREIKIEKFDMVMTSPPYVGLIDYHEQHRYAYELLGLPRREQDEIGAAFKGKSVAAHEQYMNGIKATLSNARKYMQKGGKAVIVIGDRERLYTDELARDLNFRVATRLSRHVNRRTGRRNADFFEDVLIWEAK